MWTKDSKLDGVKPNLEPEQLSKLQDRNKLLDILENQGQQIVVVGDTSSGKSTTINFLLGYPFNFVAQGIGTRRPCVMTLTPDPEREKVLFRTKFQKNDYTKEEDFTSLADVNAATCNFQGGICAQGAACKFSHQLSQDESPLRMEKLRLQVEYYLSDENLATDSFFQALIRGSSGGWVPVSTFQGCPRIQQLKATSEELVASLRWSTQLQLREWPVGAEEVRRKNPLPELLAPKPPEPLNEDTLEERPLVLLRDCCDGWQAVVEDLERRSFCFLKRRPISEALLREEFQELLAFADWQTLRSKAGAVTRSTAWYVSPGCCCRYTYGEASVQAREKPEWLHHVEARILGDLCGLSRDQWPNSVNMNLYEDESQNVGWHSDDEGLFRGCQTDCRIISASWGASRRFEIALKDRSHISGKPSIFHDTLQGIDLHSGDLCSMEGAFQRHYSHQIAKGAASSPASSPAASLEKSCPYSTARINLTWRYIVSHKPYCPQSRVDQRQAPCTA